jgi:uncharacterized protein (TIGR02421 family)
MASCEALEIRNACGLLYSATRSVRVLTQISWPNRIRDRFLEQNAKELPQVEYEPYDTSEALERIVLARSSFRFSPMVNEWLNITAYNIETSAKMIASCGTSDFFRYSRELYGVPNEVLSDQENTTLGLATQFDAAFQEFEGLDLGEPDDADVTAGEMADAMRAEVNQTFGVLAPEVQLVDELSANAIAGPSRIRIRKGAQFTDRDVRQLIHHEAHIHVGTSLNGIGQANLQVLAASHPGTTKTQEGLAVFAEFITGSMDLNRFRRLADRVIAIQMAIEGADFLQVYEFYLERTDGDREQAFENTRRVFRGGVLTGGAPFTKDIVYLDGLIRVHNFLRTMVAAGRADCLRLLFCGKIDLEDLPVLGHFAERGVCTPPEFVPPWATDIRFLLCYLTYSSFLNRIDLTQVKTHYAKMLDRIPPQDI